MSGPWAVHYSRCICQYRYVCIRVCSRSHLGSMTPTKFWQGHSWRTGNKQSTGQWELNREQAGAHTTSHPKNGHFTFDFDFDFYFWFWLWFWFWFWLWFWKWTLLKIWIHLIDIHFDSICQYRYVCIHVCDMYVYMCVPVAIWAQWRQHSFGKGRAAGSHQQLFTKCWKALELKCASRSLLRQVQRPLAWSQ